jgi:hypothetical protein
MAMAMAMAMAMVIRNRIDLAFVVGRLPAEGRRTNGSLPTSLSNCRLWVRSALVHRLIFFGGFGPRAHAYTAVRATPRSRDVPTVCHPAHSAAPLFVLALCVGCVQVEPKFPRSASPSPTSGYVGGLFSKDTIVGFGFRLQDEQTKQTYVIEVEDKAVAVIAVPPGTYHVESWLTWAALTGEKLTEQVIPSGTRFGRSFDVQAGQVVLLGSWFADRHMGFGSNTFTINSAPITETEAIGALYAAYPRFVDVPVHCLHCTP